MMKSKWRMLLWIAAILALAAGETGSMETADGSDVDDDQSPPSLDLGILSWIHNTEEGFYSPKQEFRHADPEDPTSLLGVFATERIEEDELLVRVPWNYIIKGENPEDKEQMTCDMILELAREMRLGNESHFGPYINYVNRQRDGQLPSVWSEGGKAVLQQLIGTEGHNRRAFEIPPGEPVSWIAHGWQTECEGDPDDKVAEKAAVLALLRADDSLMIPAYDFYNHRNGKWHNAETFIRWGLSHDTRAKRVIEPGEQIYISYNRCPECENRAEGYGTAELMRDYGFVEVFPQRWHYYGDDLIEFELDESADGEFFVLDWVNEPEGIASKIVRQWLQRQLQRLDYLGSVQWHQLRQRQEELPVESEDRIPDSEWSVIEQFRTANMVAMVVAMEALDGTTLIPKANVKDILADSYTRDESTSVYDHDYEPLECSLRRYHSYEPIDMTRSFYNTLEFTVHPRLKDKCMYRNQINHVCSSFRPSFYETFVHSAASYLSSVQSVLIIADGASFFLHEVLKYDSIKSIVVIEADQTVTRKVYQHFQVDPHFDDPRVKWWFGDPQEVLALMPLEKWGSFDLILNETPNPGYLLEYSVLMRANGIMAMSDFPLGHMMEAFQFSARLLFDSPSACGRVLLLGSHSVDFLHAEVTDHELDTVWYEASWMEEQKLRLIHDFIRSEPTSKNFTSPASNMDDGMGILQIVDAGQTEIDIEKVHKSIEEILESQNFHLLSTVALEVDGRLYLLKEGYVVLRWDETEKFVGLDIHLSSSIHKSELLQSLIVESLGASSSATYRLLTDGLQGPEKESPEKACLAPPQAAAFDARPLEASIAELLLPEIVPHFFDDDVAALVVCGIDCKTQSILSNIEQVKTSLSFPVCSDGIAGVSVELSKDESTMLACERALDDWIQENLILAGLVVDLIVVEGALSSDFIMLLDRVMNLDKERKQWISQQNVAFVLPPCDGQAVELHNFLDNFHRLETRVPLTYADVYLSASARAEFVVEGAETPMELGVVSQGRKLNVLGIGKLHAKFNEKLGNGRVSIRTLRGGEVQFSLSDRLNPLPFAGGNQAPKYQESTEPLAIQVYMQCELTSAELSLSRQVVDSFLEDTFEALETDLKIIRDSSKKWFDQIDAAIAEFEHGNLIAAWYGEKFIDLNLFLKYEGDEDIDFSIVFARQFLKASDCSLFGMDEIPRGTDSITTMPRTDA